MFNILVPLFSLTLHLPKDAGLIAVSARQTQGRGRYSAPCTAAYATNTHASIILNRQSFRCLCFLGVYSSYFVPSCLSCVCCRSGRECMAQPSGLRHVHSGAPGGAELQARTEDPLLTASGRSGGGGGSPHSSWIPGTSSHVLPSLAPWARHLLRHCIQTSFK